MDQSLLRKHDATDSVCGSFFWHHISFRIQSCAIETLMNFIIALQGGYRGFYSRNTIDLTPKTVNDIHKRGGTVLKTSRGGHDNMKIVDAIQDRGINQVRIQFAVLSSMTAEVLELILKSGVRCSV